MWSASMRTQARKDAADREPSLQRSKRDSSRATNLLWETRASVSILQAPEATSPSTMKRLRLSHALTASGFWRTNTSLSAEEVALKYKQLWMVEQLFRSAKTLMSIRPGATTEYDRTIRGHVFCSFLALVLRRALQERLEAKDRPASGQTSSLIWKA